MMDESKQTEKVGIPNRDVGDDLAESVLGAPEHGQLTAYDFRQELQSLLGWTDDELSALPVVYGGELQDNEIYIDLDHPAQGEFRATDRATINPGCRYVPKHGVPEALWYRLGTSINAEQVPSGNAAATPGAFGQRSTEEVSIKEGGTASDNLGTETLEVGEDM